MSDLLIRPGIGIYSRVDAAHLLRMRPARLRRWVSGYTYWLSDSTSEKSRRSRPPVISTDLPVIDDTIALSFLELMELRVVKAIVDKGLALQGVRIAAKVASERFHTQHPFASRRVFTDGKAIFSAISDHPDHPDVVRWKKGDIDQVVAGAIFDQFLQEIEFDSKTSLAQRWWPRGRNFPVLLDPRISFGAPVIAGTAVRTSVVARMAHRASMSDAAVAFELQLEQAEAAIEFESLLAAA